jgi:hypothetical protein
MPLHRDARGVVEPEEDVMRRIRSIVLVGVISAALAVPGVASAGTGTPTCSGIVGDVHGHHIVGDYVTGVGHDNMTWPPKGQVNASGGAVLPGGPGPGFHFPNGFAPGASFCNSQSNSPGLHF